LHIQVTYWDKRYKWLLEILLVSNISSRRIVLLHHNQEILTNSNNKYPGNTD
jgi:hypothetical protein